ncbi:unnamed protein product [Tetraodon nigroviridis]|uniref:(spotted green pufferfish) hypothetical protein n=1 Tax=Tetraodon nigroviridis TaxID=99883 RepID=Q4SE56_TETNG|nr:unnamed protein product [Tetraodon nigroviridis]
MEAVCVWLTDRLDLQLHSFQLRTLISVVKSTSRDLRLQGSWMQGGATGATRACAGG